MTQPKRPLPAEESAVGEEDPGSALDAEEAPPYAEDEASGLIEAPAPPGASEAVKKAHNFPDGGGSGGAEAFRTRKDLRGRNKPLGD